MIFLRLLMTAVLLLATGSAIAQLGPAPYATQPVIPQGGNAARTIAGKLGEQLSLLDFGAKCDGTTNDSAAVLAAAASGKPISIPPGMTCSAPTAVSVFNGAPGLFVGPGKLIDAGGNVHNPRSAAIKTTPNPTAWNNTGNVNVDCTASFACGGQWDFSHVLPPEEWFISDSNGGHTLGQPVHGYEYMPGTIPHQVFFNNSSGWNNNPGSNDGRTAAAWQRIIAQQNGQGDMIVNEAEILCSGQGGHPTAANGAATTNIFANPGCSWEAGDITALYPNQYLQHDEWHFNDGGNDVGILGVAHGYNRAFTGTPGMNNFVADQFVTCNGGAGVCDALAMYTGSWRLGLDFVELPAINAIPYPLVMGRGQRIALNAVAGSGSLTPNLTTTGGDWLGYDSATASVQLADGGAPVLQLSNPQPGTDGISTAVNHLAISGGATGASVTLNPVGSDSAIPLLIQDKGGAGIIGVSNGSFVMKQVAPANGSSYLQIGPGGSGQPFSIQVQSFNQTDLQLVPTTGGSVHPVGNFRIDMQTPASSTAACVAGQMTFDTSFQYDCVATNTWKRFTLSSW